MGTTVSLPVALAAALAAALATAVLAPHLRRGPRKARATASELSTMAGYLAVAMIVAVPFLYALHRVTATNFYFSHLLDMTPVDWLRLSMWDGTMVTVVLAGVLRRPGALRIGLLLGAAPAPMLLGAFAAMGFDYIGSWRAVAGLALMPAVALAIAAGPRRLLGLALGVFGAALSSAAIWVVAFGPRLA